MFVYFRFVQFRCFFWETQKALDWRNIRSLLLFHVTLLFTLVCNLHFSFLCRINLWHVLAWNIKFFTKMSDAFCKSWCGYKSCIARNKVNIWMFVWQQKDTKLASACYLPATKGHSSVSVFCAVKNAKTKRKTSLHLRNPAESVKRYWMESFA